MSESEYDSETSSNAGGGIGIKTPMGEIDADKLNTGLFTAAIN